MKIITLFKENKLLTSIIVISAILRIYHIDFQSVWLDEVHTLNEANPQKTIKEVYEALLVAEPHPPLYFFLVHILFKVFGYTTLVARIFSAFLGIAGVFSVYLLGKELYSKKVGVYATILVSINYFHIYYSQDARMYPLLFLTTAISFLYLIKFIKTPSYKSAILFSIFSSLMIYSHFFALFVLVSQYLILLYFVIKPFQTTRKQFFIYSLVSGIITVIFYLPTYGLILKTTEMTSIWIQMPTLDVYTQFFKDFFGQSELVIFFIVSLIILFFIQLFKQKNTQNLTINPNVDKLVFSFLVLFIWILITLLIPLIRTYTSLPMLVNRYFIAILPAIIIIVAIGLNSIKNDIVRYTILSIIVVFSITDVVVVKKYYKVPNKTQFREVTQFIISHNINKEPVVSSLSWYFPYFLNNDKIKTEIIDGTLDNYVAEMIKDSTKIKPFWYTDAHGRPYSVAENTQEFLEKKFFIDNNFDGYDTWTKHYELKSNEKKTIDISKYLPLKQNNGDEIKYWIDKFNFDDKKLEIIGWSYLANINANDSKIEIVLIDNKIANKVLSQSVVRTDISSSISNKFNLDNSGFMVSINKENLPKGNFTIGIYIKNSKLNKEGLILTDKLLSN